MSETAVKVDTAETRVLANGLEHHVITWTASDVPAKGETVVLCHGFLDLAWSWDRVARRVARQGYRVVAFDWRGHGESDWIGRGGYYHFPDYVLDLAELLPQLSDAPPHLVGHSMGGTACATFAGTKPDAILTLALLEGIGPDAHDPAIAPDRFGAWLRTVERVRTRAPRVMRSTAEALERMRVQNPELDDAFGAFLAGESTKPSDDGAGLVFRFDPLHQTTSPMAFQLEGFQAFLRRISVPTLVVRATHGYHPAGELERVALLRTHSVVEVEGVGHMMHRSAPDSVADALVAHFSATGGGS
jgi:pimeloyl-ACP methyl ester carboxylesterase